MLGERSVLKISFVGVWSLSWFTQSHPMDHFDSLDMTRINAPFSSRNLWLSALS